MIGYTPFLARSPGFVRTAPIAAPQNDERRVPGPRIEHTLLLFLLLFQFKWYPPLMGTEGSRIEAYDLIYALWLVQVALAVASGDGRFLKCKS